MTHRALPQKTDLIERIKIRKTTGEAGREHSKKKEEQNGRLRGSAVTQNLTGVTTAAAMTRKVKYQTRMTQALEFFFFFFFLFFFFFFLLD